MRLDLPPELLAKVEELSQEEGLSKAKIISRILAWYFSDRRNPHSNVLENEKEKEKEDCPQIRRDLEAALSERDLYHNNLEWLKGEYALVTTKLLPAVTRRWYDPLKKLVFWKRN